MAIIVALSMPVEDRWREGRVPCADRRSTFTPRHLLELLPVSMLQVPLAAGC